MEIALPDIGVVQAGKFVRVLLFQQGGTIEGTIDCPLDCFVELRSDWSPLLAGEDDESWDWRQIADECPHGQGFVQYVLRSNGRVQGVMVLKLRQDMRSAEFTNLDACYLEYMATAPWNRPSVIGRHSSGLPPKVGGVGSLFLTLAIRVSEKEGLGGRLAWHSKAGAVAFYRQQLPNALDLGPDRSEQGLDYFELGEGEGFKLLEETGSRFLDDES